MPKKPPLDQAQFRVGDAMVHPERLVISINDEEHSIEPRIMEVLIALASAAQNNETLSAVNLYIRAWIGGAHAEGNAPDPRIDVMQAENPVHKAITHLRKVFGDDPKSPRYIETIRKRGYRLVARVVYQDHYRRVAVARKIWTTGSPYVGLNAFDSRHAGIFLGRSRTTGELIESVRRQIDQQRRLVLVVGASGCGKTSLVNAGAIPILTEKSGYDGLRALSVARCDLAGTRREDALPRLAAALMQWTLDRREILPPQPVETLAGTLRGQPESLSDTLEDAFRRHANRDISSLSHPHLLLVIDHAEAIVADPSFGSDDHAEIDRFLHHLCESRHVCVIVVVRGDFYLALAEALPGMTERKSGDGHVDVLAPRTGEIGDIIRIPAASAGLEFEQNPESKDYLDDVLLRAAVAQPDALPLLQHTLQMLYERRNDRNQLCFDAYHEIGGLEGALSHHAEHVFTGLPDEIQASLDQMLSRMVVMQPENDRVSARRIPRSMLDAPAIALAEAFVQARLFVAEHENGDAHYRVAHEALLRRWPRAVEWIRENRRMLMARIRLQYAAARWAEEGRRDDHLISFEQTLIEAEQSGLTYNQPTSDQEAEFLGASRKLIKRKSTIRFSVIFFLASLSIASAVLAHTSINMKNDAVSRRNQTVRLIDFMLTKLGNELRKRGDIKLLGTISTEAISVLQTKTLDEMTTEELIQHSKSLSLLGEVSIQNGSFPEAVEAIQAAYKASQSAAKISPRSTQALNEMAQSTFWLGELERRSSRHREALRHWNEYLEISRRLVQLEPNEDNWSLEKSYALNNIGSLLAEKNRHREAISYFSESRDIKQSILKNDPDNQTIRKELLDTLSWISSSNLYLGNISEARTGYDNEVSAGRELTKLDDSALAWKRWLANALVRRASLAAATGNPAQSLRDLNESIELLEKISNKHPENIGWRRDLALAHMKFAEIASWLDIDRDPAGHLDSAKAAADKFPKGSDIDVDLSTIKIMIRFRHALQTQSTEESKLIINKSISDLSLLNSSNPNDEFVIETLTSCLIDRAMGRMSLDLISLATSDARMAIELIRPGISQTQNPARLSQWVSAHILIGELKAIEEDARWLDKIGYVDRQMHEARRLSEKRQGNRH